MDEPDFDIKSKEALVWLAGFFAGEGTVCISYSGGSFVGVVQIAQKNQRLLHLVYGIVASRGLVAQEPHYSEGINCFHLNFNRVKGSEFLRLIMPYPMRRKHRRRAEIYLKMFPPGERYVQRKVERMAIWAEYLQLKINELKVK